MKVLGGADREYRIAHAGDSRYLIYSERKILRCIRAHAVVRGERDGERTACRRGVPLIHLYWR